MNLIWNTAMPLAGAVLAPITLSLGPVPAFNALFVLGPPLTSWTASLWLRRHVRRSSPAWLGGAVVGFGPFEAAHLVGHAQLVVLPLVPLILYLLEDVIWRAPDHRRRRGVILGVVVAGEALLSEEVLVLVAAGVVVAALVALVLRPSVTASALRAGLPAGLVALAVGAALLAWPIGTQLFGPLRASGVTYASVVAGSRDLVSPTSRFWLHPFSPTRSRHLSEKGSYLGLPMLVLLAVGLVLLRRQWTAWVAALTAVVCFVLSTGAGVNQRGYAAWRLPLGPLFHLPVLSAIVARRFALPVDLAVALLAAMTVDELIGRQSRRVAALSAGAIALVVASLVPNAPPGSRERIELPSFFTSSAVHEIPDGGLVVLLPAPDSASQIAMLWAAEAQLRFRMVGGESYTKIHGTLVLHAPPDPITALANRMSATGALLPPGQVRTTRTALERLGVQDVLVVPEQDPDRNYQRAAAVVLGRPSSTQGGVLVWTVPDI